LMIWSFTARPQKTTSSIWMLCSRNFEQWGLCSLYQIDEEPPAFSILWFVQWSQEKFLPLD
jgi:hypothetical protein